MVPRVCVRKEFELVVRLYYPIIYGIFLKHLQKIFDEQEKCGVKLPGQCVMYGGWKVLKGSANLLGEDVIFLRTLYEH